MLLNNKIIVIFVEGDTDKEFFDALIQYYRNSTSKAIPAVRVINLKGIGRYESKVSSKVKYEVLSKYEAECVVIFCVYDTDVFELGKKPPTNWDIVEKKLKEIGVSSFKKIQAVHCIEDWFLLDLSGLLSYLKLKKSPNLKGMTGLEKMKAIFKKGNKIYQKGTYSHKFIPNLNFELIISKLQKLLKSLEIEIGIRSKPKGYR